MTSSVDDIIKRRPGRIDRAPCTAIVVSTDPEEGASVVPLDGDTRNPIGPCFGARPDVGTYVLLVFTDGGPWIAATDQGA